MKKSKRVIIALIIVVALGLIIKKKIELAHAPVFGNRPQLVSVFYAQNRDISRFQEYLAEVQPANKANISTKIPAMVKEVFVDEGDVVKKDSLLARLDDKELMAKLASSNEALASAQENFDYWQKEFNRDEALFKEGAISEEEMDRARNAFARSKAQLEAAKSAVDVINASLDYVEIKSPYDGVVSRRFVDPGDLAVIGRPIFVVEDRSSLKLSFDVPQEDIPDIKEGAQISFRVKGKECRAKITKVFPSLDKARMLHVEAMLDDGGNFVSGEFVPIRVLLESKKDVVVVPRQSIAKTPDGRPFVFLVKDNKLVKFPVSLGIESDEFVEVKNLESGAAVVKSPYLSWTKLFDGEKVKVRNSK